MIELPYSIADCRQTRRDGMARVGYTRILIATLAAIASLALGEEQPVSSDAIQSLAPTTIDPPAPPGSTSPAIGAESVTTLRRELDLLMTWLEPGEPGGRLRFARHSGEAWSQPITIAEPVSTLDATDRPSLTVLDTQSVRRTLIARTGDVVARSGDAGRTWTRLPAPSLAFASFAGGDEGGYAFWLNADEDGSAKLLGTRILAGETLLDSSAAGVGTSAAMTWDGPVVVYRDGSAEGAQDIVMIRRQNAEWTRPRPVHHVPGWHPAQTPKSGPEVAARRRQVAVAWYSETPHRPRVLVAFSADAGRSFGAPVEVDAKKGDRAPLAFVDVTLDDDGHALVLWMATTGPTEATLNLARVSSGGQRGEIRVLATGLPARSGAIPQIARAGGRVAVTWIEGVPEPPAAGRLRAVAVPLTAIPAPGSHRPGPVVASEGAPRTGSDQKPASEAMLDFELMSLDGEEVSLAALRGRAVLLNLWATWCLPCIAEMPELATLHRHYGPQGLVVVGLSVDDVNAATRVRAFVSERKIPFAVWLDPEMRVYHDQRVKSLPVTLVLDRQGRIVLRRDGVIKASDPELRQALSRALSDS